MGPVVWADVGGGLEGVEIIIGCILAGIVVAIIVIPLLLFGFELIIAGLLLAAGVVARSAFGRPWTVLAVPGDERSVALAWEVKGWRRSTQLIDEVAAELSAGRTPSTAIDRKDALGDP